jgi:hypothetical protein
MHVSGEAVSADTVAAEEFLNLFSELIEKGVYLPEHVFNVDDTGSLQPLTWSPRFPYWSYLDSN